MNKIEKEIKLIKILQFIENYKLTNTIINEDLTVDVNGDVNLRNKKLREIPIQFGKVSGYFDICINYLKSLKGCPKWVGENFWCDLNGLTTLEGCPEYVGGWFNCSYNQLKSLKGCPKYVAGDFECEGNSQITPESLKEIGGVKGKVLFDFFKGKLEDYTE